MYLMTRGKQQHNSPPPVPRWEVDLSAKFSDPGRNLAQLAPGSQSEEAFRAEVANDVAAAAGVGLSAVTVSAPVAGDSLGMDLGGAEEEEDLRHSSYAR